MFGLLLSIWVPHGGSHFPMVTSCDIMCTPRSRSEIDFAYRFCLVIKQIYYTNCRLKCHDNSWFQVSCLFQCLEVVQQGTWLISRLQTPCHQSAPFPSWRHDHSLGHNREDKEAEELPQYFSVWVLGALDLRAKLGDSADPSSWILQRDS